MVAAAGAGGAGLNEASCAYSPGRRCTAAPGAESALNNCGRIFLGWLKNGDYRQQAHPISKLDAESVGIWEVADFYGAGGAMHFLELN